LGRLKTQLRASFFKNITEEPGGRDLYGSTPGSRVYDHDMRGRHPSGRRIMEVTMLIAMVRWRRSVFLEALNSLKSSVIRLD
jgi:hypothetical protein